MDSGYIHDGVTEKATNLAIAQKMKKLLEDQEYHVHMTRYDDATVSLTDRTKQTNKLGNVLAFISVHSNAASQSRISGIETFCCGDEMFKKRESLMDPHDEKLLDRYKKELSKQSKALASDVHHALLGEVKKVNSDVVDRKIKHNPGQVLLVEAPAILVEFGFLSNPVERALLQSDEYISCLARGAAQGISRFLQTSFA